MQCVDGSWLEQVINCRAVQCPPLVAPENVRKDSSGTGYNDRVEFSCDQGFSLIGESVLTCQSDETWSADVPVCTARENYCDVTLVQVDNADVTLDPSTLVFGTVATISCSSGNVPIDGTREIQRSCLGNGDWSDGSLTCIPSDACRNPPEIENASHDDKQSYANGERLFYSCNAGYEPVSSSYLQCVDGNWSEADIRCTAKSCGYPGDINNGGIIEEVYTYPNSVTYVCHEGFTLNGRTTRTCQANQHWSGIAPSCNHACRNPPEIENASHDDKQSYANGERLFYSCNAGYEPVSSSYLQCVDGNWSEADIRCTAKSCGYPGDINNGGIIEEVYTYPNSVTYVCHEGFTLNGRTTRTCQANQHWSGIAPSCNPVKCPMLDAPEEGRKDGSGTGYNDRVEFSCDQGFSLNGESVLTCQGDGTWSADVPECTGYCQKPREDVMWVFNDSCQGISVQPNKCGLSYLCDDGYFPINQKVIWSCSKGIWQKNAEPICSTVKPDCSDDEFACTSGLCVPSSALCDGYNDCGNMDDEFSMCNLDLTFCAKETVNNTLAGQLTFNDVNIAQRIDSVEVCPIYTSEAGTPRASRACIGDFVDPSVWAEEVQINNCYREADDQDHNLQDLSEYLDDNPVTNDNVTTLSRDLADVTKTDDLDRDDLVTVAKLLEMIIVLNVSLPEVTRNVIEVVDNVLDLDENVYNESTPFEAPSRILQALETQLTNLHQQAEDLNFTEVRDSIAVRAFTADQNTFLSEITFGTFFNSNTRNIQEDLDDSLINVFKDAGPSILDDVKASITLPTSLLDAIQYAPSDAVPLTFVIYRTSNLFISNGSSQMDEEVETLIVSATIEGQKITNLNDPVVTRFHILPIEGLTTDTTRQCVFWDFSLAGGFGDWSSEGCELVSGPGENGDPLVECHCSHLTNFAVLMDIQGDLGSLVLDVLSIIGCVISIVALLITLIAFLAIKKLRSKRPQQVLINLCFALLGLYLSFLIGINRANLDVGCVIFGALIHYFCLASISWMSVEATIMYLLFVKVFDAGIKYFMRKASLVAWGLPLVVVIVSAILKPNNYTGKYCFPHAGTLTFYIGVLLLIGLMLCYNLVLFTLVVRQLALRRKSMIENDKRSELVKRVQNAVAISVLLGLAWLFGFLAIGGAQFIFNLLFLIFNTLQGLFVFLFFCLRNKDIATLWREKLYTGSYDYRGPQAVNKTGGPRNSSAATIPANTTPRETISSDKQTDSTAGGGESIQMIATQG
ncbi:uncharacterized protein [Apostichopus japonicus]|uniref:uncharacterized protein n=1 Tax=Stichopus japonicus TaxID=307972 RepID=UPI003AB801FE